MQNTPEPGGPTPTPMTPTSGGLIPNPSFPIMISSLSISSAFHFGFVFLIMDAGGDETGNETGDPAVCDNSVSAV